MKGSNQTNSNLKAKLHVERALWSAKSRGRLGARSQQGGLPVHRPGPAGSFHSSCGCECGRKNSRPDWRTHLISSISSFRCLGTVAVKRKHQKRLGSFDVHPHPSTPSSSIWHLCALYAGNNLCVVSAAFFFLQPPAPGEPKSEYTILLRRSAVIWSRQL